MVTSQRTVHGHGGLVCGFPTCIGSCALLQRRNERANDGKRLTMVCCWWDFQATLGKTILLSDIAGTALSTTRLVDWLLLMLLNPLVDFHRDRTICFRVPDRRVKLRSCLSKGGEIKGIVSQCIQNNSTDNIAIIYRNSGRFYLIESITCVISINEYFLSSLSAWIAIEKPWIFKIINILY